MTLTQIVISITIVGLLSYDVWTCGANGAQTSISWVVYTTAQKYPAESFAIGFVMGHLFWVQHGG